MAAQQFKTTGQIAIELGVGVHKVQRVVDRLNIEASAHAVTWRLFDAAGVDAIRRALTDIEQRSNSRRATVPA